MANDRSIMFGSTLPKHSPAMVPNQLGLKGASAIEFAQKPTLDGIGERNPAQAVVEGKQLTGGNAGMFAKFATHTQASIQGSKVNIQG